MNRTVFFAHFDGQNEVKPYVYFYLEKLRQLCSRVVFVSTSRVPAADLDRVRGKCDLVLLRENVGWDFGMWKDAFEHTDLSDTDELVLTNSSVFGPIYPLEPILSQMSSLPSDFWSMTDNFEFHWHLQSYFVVFKRKAFSSDAFRLFWNSVLPYRSKVPVVLSYEIGLTSFMLDSGFRPGVFAPIDSWSSWPQRRRMDLSRRWNPTLFHPAELLARGMPFVKAGLLRDNIGEVRLDPVYRAMSRAGYDRELVAFDRPPPTRARKLRSRLRRAWSHFAHYSEGSSPIARCALSPTH
jgi:lipopolysaccharide biosynthesis protein